MSVFGIFGITADQNPDSTIEKSYRAPLPSQTQDNQKSFQNYHFGCRKTNVHSVLYRTFEFGIFSCVQITTNIVQLKLTAFLTINATKWPKQFPFHGSVYELWRQLQNSTGLKRQLNHCKNCQRETYNVSKSISVHFNNNTLIEINNFLHSIQQNEVRFDLKQLASFQKAFSKQLHDNQNKHQTSSR